MILELMQEIHTTQYAMGTVMSHKVYGLAPADGLGAACSEIDRIERLLSRFIPESEISQINRSAGFTPEPVSPDTFEVLSRAVDFSRNFPGTFDLTIEPLVHLWKRARDTQTTPTVEAIEQTLTLINYRDLSLNLWEMTAELKYFGQSIDLGGIGKGFAADKVRRVLNRSGVSSAYSNLGGNVVVVGSKPDGSPWKVGIQHPCDETRLIGALSVVDQTVVTSGDYQRFYVDETGKRRHHILSPRTGYPVETDLLSVTVVTDSSLTADALSTILFITGLDQGAFILSRYANTEAVFVDKNLQVFVTSGLKGRFECGDDISGIKWI